MTKKHFQCLADNIAMIKSPGARVLAYEAVCNACQTMNPLFSWSKFMRACGLKMNNKGKIVCDK